jgi:hypothetical protein
MRRPFTISSFALAVALAPAVLFAQATPPAQQPPTQPPAGQAPAGQPPAGQPPAGQPGAQPAAPEKPAAPKLTFKGTAGMLLVQVKPDQTAAFEEMITKLKTSTASATDPQVKQQSQVKAYRSAEPAPGGNVFYILLYDPTTAGTEYNWLDVINSTLTPEQQRDPATRESYVKYAGSVASMNILNLTEIK